MILLLLALGLQAPSAAPIERAAVPSATVPRIDATATIDGHLDEPAWSQAAHLTNFKQRTPVDVNGGGPATEQSDVLVWYSPQALYIGVIARDREASAIRASLARRDNLDQEDTMSFFLDTFNDHRRAFVFTVNPLGAQQDGVQSEGGAGGGVGAGGGGGAGLDKNPDYRFDSAGRLTPEGYEIEVRIPFKSLRYQGNGPQRWGFNVSRKIQRTGHEDTWTDVRPGASFLAQSGVLDGLHDLDRGVVTEIQPFVTAAGNGARAGTTGAFTRDHPTGSTGLNARLGFTNVSIDATVNPDFSQVESDAGLVTINERFALSVPEKRPFFLEGIDLFSTPNQLVYTRQVLNPIAGGKLTGKVGNFGIAYLGAVDERPTNNSVFNIARIRRDFGRSSLAGVTYTDQMSEGTFNRVLAGDVRLVFRRLYYAQVQLGRSWSETGNVQTGSPIWNAIYDRTGRMYGFHYEVNGVGEQFETRSGFVPRTNFVQARYSQRFTHDGKRGARFEQITFRINPTRVWNYAEFLKTSPIEGNDSVALQTRLHGGWGVNGTLGRQYYRLDSATYAGYTVVDSAGAHPFDAPESLDGLILRDFQLTTPSFQMFTGTMDLSRNGVPIFAEAARGNETRLTSTLAFRPSTQVRTELSTTISRITRQRDGSPFANTTIPRLKVEFQPRRSLFFRVIGEYRSQRQEALLDPGTGAPLYIGGVPKGVQESNAFRVDYLASFEPQPGTAAYFGYGSTMTADQMLSFRDLTRTADGFFVKVAYQFRR